MVTRYGMSDEFGMMALETAVHPYLSDETRMLVSPETATKIDQEVQKILKQCYDRAMEILQEHEDKMHELADYLFEKETIDGDEFIEMFAKK